MWDLLPVGTLVEVNEPPNRPRYQPYYIARVIGYHTGAVDMPDRYHLSIRFLRMTAGWWEWSRGGGVAFLDEAQAIEECDVPTLAGLCNGCGAPVIFGDGWDGCDPTASLHLRIPAPGTVEFANIWDSDAAQARKYPALPPMPNWA